MKQFALFCISGCLAFAIDGGLTQFGVGVAGFDPWLARGLAFPLAVTFTWWFNRHFTFRAAPRGSLGREWSIYVGTQLVGWTLNLGSYALVVALFDPARRWPVIAVAVGSVIGLAANFLGAKHVAFKPLR